MVNDVVQNTVIGYECERINNVTFESLTRLKRREIRNRICFRRLTAYVNIVIDLRGNKDGMAEVDFLSQEIHFGLLKFYDWLFSAKPQNDWIEEIFRFFEKNDIEKKSKNTWHGFF